MFGIAVLCILVNSHRDVQSTSDMTARPVYGRTPTGTGVLQHRRDEPTPLEELARSHTRQACPPPMIELEDRIVVGINSTTTSSTPPSAIPKQIHVAWIRGSESNTSRCFPEEYVQWTGFWKQNFPSYSFYLHDDFAVDTLLREYVPEFPQLQKLMTACVQFGGAIKVDIWRVLVLYKYGGIYSDIDVAPGRDFTEASILPNYTAFFLSDGWNRPSQWTHAMKPRHPIAYFTMLEILTRVSAMEDVSHIKPVFTTGPDALKHGYGKALNWGNTGDAVDPDIYSTGVHRDKFGNYLYKVDQKEMKKKQYTRPAEFNHGEVMERALNASHWVKDIRKRAGIPTGSCWDQLHLADEKIHG